MSSSLARRPGPPARSWRGVALCLALLGCDESFHFDVPDTRARLDSGTAQLPSRCRGDEDCALDSLHCDTSIERCVECVVDEDCSRPTSPRCDTGLTRCVQCRVARDCPEGSTCDVTTHRCLTGCVEEVDCDPSAHDCDERRGICIQCDDDAECATALEGSYCDGTRCVQCRADSHCAPGNLCDSLTGTCIECRDGRDCPAAASCDPGQHVCVAAP